MPMGWLYMAPTIGFGLVIWRLLQQILAEARALRQEAES